MFKSRYITCVVSIVLLNLLYFIWQPFSKDIICYQLSNVNVSDLLTNIIFFSISFIVYLIISNVLFNRDILKKLHKLRAVKVIVLLFGIQICSDAIKIIANVYLSDYIFIINDLCAIMCFTLSFVLLIKMVGGEPRNDHKNYITNIFYALSAIVFVIFEFNNFRDATYISNLTSKFNENFEPFRMMLQNHYFMQEIQSMFVETICTVLIFTGLYQKYAINPALKKSNDNSMSKEIARVVSRIIVSSLCAIVILSIKVLALPQSSIGIINRAESNIVIYNSNGKINGFSEKLYVEHSDIKVNRRQNYNKQQPVYKVNNVYFKVNNSIIYTLKSDYDVYNDLPKQLYVMQDYQVADVEFKTFGNELLILCNNGSYEFLELTQLQTLPYNNSVIQCCKYMISNGNFSYFEYSYEYFLKYDADFIKPYIEQYSRGEFTQKELKNPYNTGINTEYIQELATQFNGG